VGDDLVLAEPATPLGEERDLVGHGDGRGVDGERARPVHLAVGGLRRQLDLAAAGMARHAGHLACLAHEAGRLLGAHIDRSGEADGAVLDDPYPHAEVGAVRRGLGLRVAQAQDVAPDAFHADLGGLTARGGVQCRIR
jgi:hypothetical protein